MEVPVAVDTLALFTQKPVQTAMTGYQILNILPSNENISTSSTIEFDFPLSGNPMYYDLGHTNLFIEFETLKVADGTKATGVLPTAASGYVKGAYINMPTSSFFSDVRFLIYDKVCESTGNMYPYQSMIHDILMYTKEYRDEILIHSGYADEMSDAAATNPDSETNPGFVKHVTSFKSAESERFVGRINIGMFKQAVKIPGFVKMRLVLTKAALAFIILDPALTAATEAAKVKIALKKVRLEVHAVDVQPIIYQAHLDGLKSQNMVYHFTRECVVSETVAQGSLGKVWSNAFPTSQVPKLIVLTMVRSDAFTGSNKYNPFHFQHFNVNYIQLTVNAKPVPYVEPFQPTAWDKLQYLREYKTLDSIGEGRHGISPLAYANGHFFLVFNLCPDLIIDGAAEAIQTGGVSLDIRFSAGLSQPINILLYAQFDNSVQITKDKDVIHDFI